MATLLGPALGQLPAAAQATITGKEFFPNLISPPFHDGLFIVVVAAAARSVIAAVASLARGKKFVHGDAGPDARTAGFEPADPAAELSDS